MRSPSATPTRAVITPAPVEGRPVLDGRLNDAIWTKAVRITNFTQQRPIEGAEPSERTEVLLAHDRDALYVGIHAYYKDLSTIRANRSDRDRVWPDDNVRLYIDPFADQQLAYVFAVNGYGVQGDALLTSGGGTLSGGGRGGGGGGGADAGGGGGGGGGGGQAGGQRNDIPPGDQSWDALFYTAGRLVDDGWTAEMVIPFKSLRYPARAEGVGRRWGLQIQRTIGRGNESAVWSPTTRNIPGLLRQLGTMTGLSDLSTSRNLEFQPFFNSINSGGRDSESGVYSTSQSTEGGINGKYGLTSNLTASFTVNPDFSDVESDRPQIETNQRFPIFVPEQRPFFLEGGESFQVNAPVTLIHTKTIVDPVFGVKLAGKVGRARIGFLAGNDEAPGKIDDRDDPAFGQTARILMARARYDIYANSHVGLIFTDRSFLEQSSRVFGFDSRFQLGQNNSLSMVLIGADHDDGLGTRSRGATYEVQYFKRSRNWRWDLSQSAVAPDFHTDLGFVRRSDTRRTSGNIGYQWWPQHWMTNWGPTFGYEQIYDYSGVLQNRSYEGGLSFTLRSNITTQVEVNREVERYLDLDFSKTRYQLSTNINTSRYFSVIGNVSLGRDIRFVDNPFLGSNVRASINVSLRPFSRLRSDISLNTSRFVDTRTNTEEFDVRILRTLTTYQITNRLAARNILEYNTSDRTVGANVLFTYRVNAGTAFFAGYDDHYLQDPVDVLDARREQPWRRTNRAAFVKLQYLFRL